MTAAVLPVRPAGGGTPRAPIDRLATHDVTNQPPPLVDTNLFDTDPALVEGVAREGAGWATDRLRAFGAACGGAEAIDWGFAANRQVPELHRFDRYGRRIDEVSFHPAYHALMDMAYAAGAHAIGWTAGRAGGHVAHTAMVYLLSQVEQGVCCPVAMSYAGVPALAHQPELAEAWTPKLVAEAYDPRPIPPAEKAALTVGMAMTEKQGGSDVRANSTTAVPVGAAGPGRAYRLTGHKWFCSAPMSDGFLTLARTDTGLSCFLVPRWTPDGDRNAGLVFLRLKDKLGNRANASSEIEYHGAWAQMVGEEGHGIRTIIDMVHHTRLDTAAAPVGLMRQALAQAVHHATHRTAFQKRLVDQPLMRSVLADLTIEVEAGLALILRVARAFDGSAAGDARARAFARIAVAVAKYWLNKRAPGHVVEAMECLGGGGFIEESILPRLYREAPLNGIWEGAGNVIALDILRAAGREPESLDAVRAELDDARGLDPRLAAAVDALQAELADPDAVERRARRIAERLALALQGALLARHAPPTLADAFMATRLGGGGGISYGTLPAGLKLDDIIARAGGTP